ncbi:MAG: aminoacyl-tRNA hydrolase, partial [Planctomycetota bacterium]
LVRDRAGASDERKQFGALVSTLGSGEDRTILIKPQSYMNESGRPLRSLCGYYKVEVGDILVVCDDVALPLGKLRLRRKGSAGGQKGLRSIIRELGSDQFPRLRVGIGDAPEYMDRADYVLGKFTANETEAIEPAIAEAASCARDWLRLDMAEVMARCNAKKAEATEE